MQRTKQNHAWRVFRLLLIFFCIGLSLQFTSCGKKQAENTVFSVDDLSGKKIGVQLGTTGDTLVSDYETDGSNTTVERFNKGNDAIQPLRIRFSKTKLYLITKIGVLEWKIIRRAMLGLNKRAKTFRL